MHLQQPHPVTRVEIDASGHAVKDNATQNAFIEKRWVRITHTAGHASVKRWPDKTISYCYDTIESRDQLHEYLLAATQRWQHAGLFADAYKYVQVAEPGSSCTRHKQRTDILVISHNTEGVLRTTVGIYPLDSDLPDYVGPYSSLSTRNDVGMLDAVANIAHELGHAWGLGHEHQNPAFWKYEVSEGVPNGAQNQGSGWTWSSAQFDCKALSDYERISAQVRELQPKDLDTICVVRRVARRYGFSAMEWLPDTSSNLKREVSNIYAEESDVDWQSIMLYPSRSGGKGPAAPANEGEEMDANDGRSSVLKRRDGSNWNGNYHPSERDIRGIREIYEDDMFPGGEPILPVDEEHKHGGKFRAMARKIKCKISGGD